MIKIDAKAWEKLHFYASTANKLLGSEISGLASWDNGIIVNPILIKQVATAGDTDLSPTVLFDFIKKEKFADKKVWWHTHLSSVFWSGQDLETIKTLTNCKEFVISIVLNSQREYKARIDIKGFTSEVELTSVLVLGLSEEQKLKEEILSKVSKPKIKISSDFLFPYLDLGKHHFRENQLLDNKGKVIDNKKVEIISTKKMSKEDEEAISSFRERMGLVHPLDNDELDYGGFYGSE